MLKYKTAIALAALLFFLSGCAARTQRLGFVDAARIMGDSAVNGEITGLDKQIADTEAALSEKKETLAKGLEEREKAENEALQEEWAGAVAAREAQMNKDFEEKNKGFFEEKNKQMSEFIKTVEQETNDQLAVLSQKANSALATEAQLEDLAKEADKIKQAAEEKIKAQKARIEEEIKERMSGERGEAQRQLSEYAQRERERLVKERQESLKQFSEELLGEDQKKQNALLAQREAALKALAARVKEAVASVAEEKKLQTVVSSVFINVSAIDITDDVLKALVKK